MWRLILLDTFLYLHIWESTVLSNRPTHTAFLKFRQRGGPSGGWGAIRATPWEAVWVMDSMSGSTVYTKKEKGEVHQDEPEPAPAALCLHLVLVPPCSKNHFMSSTFTIGAHLSEEEQPETRMNSQVQNMNHFSVGSRQRTQSCSNTKQRITAEGLTMSFQTALWPTEQRFLWREFIWFKTNSSICLVMLNNLKLKHWLSEFLLLYEKPGLCV